LRITADFENAEKILELERQCTAEVEQLSRLGVFPAPEIAAAKKQAKFLRDQQDSGRISVDPQYPLYLADLELRVSENRLAIYRTRRVEEEGARAAYKKRMSKLKQQEENQSKDPMNFRNQHRF
jgi:hypothetical protein